MIIHEIKKSHLGARRYGSRVTAAFYSFVVGEIENKAMKLQDGCKTYPDALVIPLLKSIKSISLENGNKEEAAIVESFIPKQLTADEIDAIFSAGTQLTDVGMRMKYLKANHAGLYDGKMASDLAKHTPYNAVIV